jgi:hypothetical protein
MPSWSFPSRAIASSAWRTSARGRRASMRPARGPVRDPPQPRRPMGQRATGPRRRGLDDLPVALERRGAAFRRGHSGTSQRFFGRSRVTGRRLGHCGRVPPGTRASGSGGLVRRPLHRHKRRRRISWIPVIVWCVRCEASGSSRAACCLCRGRARGHDSNHVEVLVLDRGTRLSARVSDAVAPGPALAHPGTARRKRSRRAPW